MMPRYFSALFMSASAPVPREDGFLPRQSWSCSVEVLPNEWIWLFPSRQRLRSSGPVLSADKPWYFYAVPANCVLYFQPYVN